MMSGAIEISNLAYTKISNEYTLGPFLNNGAYGYVYYAQNSLKQPFAIKAAKLILQPQQNVSNGQKFKKQDQFMMVCQSDYIMKCYGSLNNEKYGIKFIILELCDLGSLQDLIYLKGCLSEYQAKIILKQLLCGLSQIHRKRQLHRDIKSANVCFKDQRCLLCDFGCAKYFLTQSQGQIWDMTRWKKGSEVGTIISKAPEVLINNEYGYRSDLWAIGILFYEMITGIPPFWFKYGLSNQQALPFVKENIQRIYEPNYINQNLKKINQTRGNSKISNQAIIFLKKLIEFDKTKRISWQQLASQVYLLEDHAESFNWQSAVYILPFKNINWHEFAKTIKEQNNFWEEKSNQAQIQIINSQPQPIKKRSQRQALMNRYEKIQNKEKQIHNEAKIMHFQIRRLSILMQIRGYLGNLQMKYILLKCDKVGYMISKYCYLKSKDLIASISHKIGFVQNFGLNALENLIKPIYQLDAENFKAQHYNITTMIKNKFYYDNNKIKFYEQIQKDTIDPIFQFIQSQAEKLKNQIKKKQEIQYQQFFEQPLQILKVTYQPTNDGNWGQWRSIRSIFNYACQKNGNKQQK